MKTIIIRAEQIDDVLQPAVCLNPIDGEITLEKFKDAVKWDIRGLNEDCEFPIPCVDDLNIDTYEISFFGQNFNVEDDRTIIWTRFLV